MKNEEGLRSADLEPRATRSRRRCAFGQVRRLAFGVTAVAALVGSETGLASAGQGWEEHGQLVRRGEKPLVGGAFELLGSLPPQTAPHGDGFVLSPGSLACALGAGGAGGAGGASCACLCAVDLFRDGFESGDASAWEAP